jgi:class 3 adenylate cyclase
LDLAGTDRRLEFTAIGDSVNTAKRIQENNQAGQIYISQSAYDRISGQVKVEQVEPILANGTHDPQNRDAKRDPIPVFQVIRVKPSKISYTFLTISRSAAIR